MLSVITPAYNEADNLPVFYRRLCAALEGFGDDWEWIVIDDHSADRTFAVIAEIAGRDARVCAWRFARNFGSHAAVACGLQKARGDCAAVLAADLQDPPETLPLLLQEREKGAQVVWAVRGQREGEKQSTKRFAGIYYWLMRKVVGMTELPATGADFFLIDRQVIDAFSRFPESNTSVFALITWMGFRQTSVVYDKQPRQSGTSGWTLRKKIKLAIDSVTSFSYLPIRLMSILGIIISMLGFLYATFIVIHALTGNPPQGWSSLIVVVLVVGGIQLLMMGVLGEYLWRALDESRRRPRYIIEAVAGLEREEKRHAE